MVNVYIFIQLEFSGRDDGIIGKVIQKGFLFCIIVQFQCIVLNMEGKVVNIINGEGIINGDVDFIFFGIVVGYVDKVVVWCIVVFEIDQFIMFFIVIGYICNFVVGQWAWQL